MEQRFRKSDNKKYSFRGIIARIQKEIQAIIKRRLSSSFDTNNPTSKAFHPFDEGSGMTIEDKKFKP